MLPNRPLRIRYVLIVEELVSYLIVGLNGLLRGFKEAFIGDI